MLQPSIVDGQKKSKTVDEIVINMILTRFFIVDKSINFEEYLDFVTFTFHKDEHSKYDSVISSPRAVLPKDTLKKQRNIKDGQWVKLKVQYLDQT